MKENFTMPMYKVCGAWKMGRVLTENGEARECSCVKEAQRWGESRQVERRAFEVQGWVWTFREQVTDALSGGGGSLDTRRINCGP